MDRRSFLKTAGAAAAAPLLPVPAIASAQAVTVNRFQIGFAALYARVNGRASPAMIQKWLRIGPEDARYVMGELRGMGILNAPIAGSATAARPMYPGGKVPGFLRKAVDAGQTVLEKMDEHLDEAEPGPMDDEFEGATDEQA